MKIGTIATSVLVSIPLLLGQAVFAQDMTATTDEVFEMEAGPISDEAAAVLTPMTMESMGIMEPNHRRGDRGRERGRERDRDRAEDVVRGIIGIIGAIAADRIDGDRRYRGRVATCYSRDYRGRVYRATSRNARAAQRQAQYKCQQYARSCRPAGCHLN